MLAQSITPLNTEVKLDEEEFIVSKTDAKGKITYVNRVFMGISGYTEPELLGQPHNMIRHPDMPRAVFKFLWDTLKNGDDFLGYVKNLCKDGRYYWVFANITPDISSRGDLKGYYSVRRKPSAEGIRVIEPIYKRMLQIETQARSRSTVTESLEFLLEEMDRLNENYISMLLRLENRG